MKYLIIAGLCLLGIIAISIRDTDLKDITELQREMVSNVNIPSLIDEKSEMNPEFNEYWYAGLAELSGYDLEQSRYGEIHKGTATMIFVTEPFSQKKQVKLDNPGSAGNDNASVLKLNFTRNFLTGIYPYNMMTSVFNPVNTNEFKNALKLTLSGQEWCGQVFMQLNKGGRNYNVKSYSYFESEGDQLFEISDAYLEDEIFNLIRLNPKLLPLGSFEIIPSAVVNRFMHEDFKPYKAEAWMDKVKWQGKELSEYAIRYESNNRLLKIYFGSEFPHMIEGWEDTYQGYGKDALTSRAVRKNTKMLDYWNKHDNKDRSLNEELYK